MKKSTSSVLLSALLVIMIILTACGGGNDLYIYMSKREIESDFPKMVEAFKAEYAARTGEELNIKLFVGQDLDFTLLKTDMGSANVNEQPTIYYIAMTELTDFVAGGQALQLKSDEVKAMHPDFYNDLVLPIAVGENLTTDGSNSFGIPINYEGYGYYMSSSTLGELFGVSGPALADLVENIKMSSYEEFIDFCLEVNRWIADPASAGDAALNGSSYSFADEKTPRTAKLTGLFSMSGIEGWTWGFHLYNKSLNLEFPTAYDTSRAPTLEWRGAESYYDILKFQFDNLTDPTPDEKDVTRGSYGGELATEAYSYNASLALFARGRALMIKQGNWAYTGIAESADGDFLDSLFFVPVKYNLNTPGVQSMSDADWTALNQIKGDTPLEKRNNFNKSITIFVPNYFVINAKADEKKQKLAMDFLHWMQTSQTGLEYITDTFAFVPYYPIPSNVNITIDNAISQTIADYAVRGLSLSNDMNAVPGTIHNDMQEWITETYLAPSDISRAGFQGFDHFRENIVEPFRDEWAVRAEQRDAVRQ